MTKRVAIAGAGIAGLAAAAAFRSFGFEVDIYEQSKEPREIGAGIYIKENSFEVLDRLGLTEGLSKRGVRIQTARIIDEDQRVVVSRDVSQERLVVALRSDLHNSLRDRALELGARLHTDRKVSGASPSGTLHFSDGSQADADLVIGADGLHSRVRDSLDLARYKIGLGDGATRVLIPRRDDEGLFSTEHWSGQLRVGVAPCSDDYTYMFIIGPERENRATRVPLDKAYWSRHFPHLAEYFDAVTPELSVHHRHHVVHCDTWVKGNVAIIGDAAHAQPPNLGQGAGVAMAAAWELAECAAYAPDIRTALADWETSSRPRINMVQRLTTAYDILNYKWPRPLAPLRSKLFSAVSNSPTLGKRWEFYWRGGAVAPRPLGNSIPSEQ
ncbi:FAD-dependent oxidoreductase [Arthrobacter crystallopoietes]|uniref:FAD-dependent oxidoreductase n=1 Tax=Crystallibacter crystallopoietes TaxID=37928 RepID=UPI0011111818|nr:FAD-dependent monooxygenase [Arthrobacter crystallopoietes]